MGDSLAHRGPDGEGRFVAGGVGLVHRRLSIIDLEGGRQPIANEDGSIQVVFNGEIYNYRELRRELEQQGHRFRTRSDTEVLVHLYEEMGERLVERLRGMFAFALWDDREQRLLLARDRVGIKPLYYERNADRIVFSSELKTLLADPSVSRTVDPAAIDEYLTFGMIGGDRSVFQGVEKLAPGHTLLISRSRWNARPHCYWRLSIEPDESRSEADWLAAVDEKLTETVAAHQIADVPVGAFLSGGIDSSAIVAKAQEAGGRLQTFSIGFREARYDEAAHARLVARHFGTEHHEEIVSPDAASGLDALLDHFDEPFADASAVPTLAVSRLARRSVKVVLSGDGGDEAFGGYRRYAHDLREAAVRRRLPRWLRETILKRLASAWPRADWLPKPLRLQTALENLSISPEAAYANTLSLFRPALRDRLWNGDMRRFLGGRPERFVETAYGANDDPLAGMLSADTAYHLPDDFLTKVDRASMACGLEVRPPLVDHELLELTARIPSRFKVRRGETKRLLKRLMRDRLPAGIVDRPKQGFELPIDDWMRGPLREVCEDVMLAQRGPLATFFDLGAVRQLHAAHLSGRGRHGLQLWALLVLAAWLERYAPPAGSNVQPATASGALATTP